LFLDLRPTSAQILRFAMTFTPTGNGAWVAEVRGQVPADLTPPPGAIVTFRAALTGSSGQSERLTRTVELRNLPPDTTPLS
jgi:hypothetical protein